MTDASALLAFEVGSVVAPAGHGKTELIANLAILGRRALVLTHTHAGVDAIRGRMKRLGVHQSAVAVDTIAGWCMRYAQAFPTAANPPDGMPRDGSEWERLYRGANEALGIAAVRRVVEASYDRILIDEYQDCLPSHHSLACTLSQIVPTLIFGDPMQGIFEFAGATLSWEREIDASFPLVGSLATPHRWEGKNVELGAWIAETRERLIQGETIDLSDPRIEFRASADAFDTSVLFEGIDERVGTCAAIYSNNKVCRQLASNTGGAYQAIEEMAAAALSGFAASWDSSEGLDGRRSALRGLLSICFRVRPEVEGEPIDSEGSATDAGLIAAVADLGLGDGCAAALEVFALARRHPRWRLFRGDLWWDAERAFKDAQAGRSLTMAEAVAKARLRTSRMGRRLTARTVSTPLLLKGLEFDHVVIPDASHFARERFAQAKLFYVAISRATRSLTISAPIADAALPNPEHVILIYDFNLMRAARRPNEESGEDCEKGEDRGGDA